MGALLFDDGERLWSVTLDGQRSLIWEHPPVAAIDIAASPDGERVALAVGLMSESADESIHVLYLLETDGSVTTVDVLDGDQVQEHAVFMRPPSDPRSQPELYWTRFELAVSTSTGKIHTQVMRYADGERQEVAVPTRNHEAVVELDAYPGAASFTLSLYRQDNVPTRAEILVNADIFGVAGDASPTLWSDNRPVLNTDALQGVAWLSPAEFVAPMADEHHDEDYQLRLFRDGCDVLGSAVVYEGADIDFGYADYFWPLLPAGDDGVLVLGAGDVQERLDAGGEGSAPWRHVSIPDGEITEPGAMFEPGAWTWVAPASDYDPGDNGELWLEEGGCDDLEWVWP